MRREPARGQRARRRFASLAVSLCISVSASAADSYWEYSYSGVDVTESRRGESAQVDCAQSAAAQIRRGKRHGNSAVRLATADRSLFDPHGHLPADTREQGQHRLVFLSLRTSTNTVLIDNSGYGADTLYNAYFGFAASVLVNEYSRNYPRWFLQGMSELFAASSMNPFTVTVGVARTRRVQALFKQNLIPVRTLLTLRRGRSANDVR